ncbi:hypothetical protein J41TS4_48920 [Paenibacillus apis]|uniref:Uncharacterized protein n=1 Tax=Paenibacillus apis TaxID=1792174 RepID=A0A919Y7B6_9BACL|nr:hypothetical protein J41TS4_48920 [Paenibacillus apis]
MTLMPIIFPAQSIGTGRTCWPDTGREVIVYYGTSVSTCPNLLTLHLLGYPQAKRYAGSWSD